MCLSILRTTGLILINLQFRGKEVTTVMIGTQTYPLQLTLSRQIG